MRASACPSLSPVRVLCLSGFLFGTIAVLIITPATVRSFAEGPFPGSTGGFGEPTCQHCHLGNDLNDPGGKLELTVPESYVPDKSYEISVVLSRTGLQRGGFQLSARVADGPDAGRDAGRLEVSGPALQIVKSQDGKVSYVQHTPEGTRRATPGTLKWTFRWVAPPQPVEVRFDVAANASNDDESPMDDYIYVESRRITGK